MKTLMPRANLLSGVLLAAMLSGCDDSPTPLEEITPRVKTFVVGERATGQSRRISGRVVAADTSPLSFGVPGTVEEVFVSQGDLVAQGQILARLDAKPFRLAVEGARAELNVARANLTKAKQTYERFSTLVARRAVSKADMDAATAKRATARANLRAAQSNLESRERELALTELAAPFAGTISARTIEPFQEVSVGQDAFVLQSAGVLKVEVQVPETLIRDVDYGQVVQVTFPTAADTAMNGIVSEIGSQAQAGNAFPVSVQLPRTGADLRPGMTASVTFNFDRYLEGRTVFLIPLSAIAIEVGLLRRASRQDAPNPQSVPVYVVGGNNQLEVRDLVVGDLRGNDLEVYEGLREGDRIVSAGVPFLREGMTVELWSPEQGLTGG